MLPTDCAWTGAFRERRLDTAFALFSDSLGFDALAVRALAVDGLFNVDSLRGEALSDVAPLASSALPATSGVEASRARRLDAGSQGFDAVTVRAFAVGRLRGTPVSDFLACTLPLDRLLVCIGNRNREKHGDGCGTFEGRGGSH